MCIRDRLKPTEKTNQFNLSFEATAGAPVPQIENGYIVKDDKDNQVLIFNLKRKSFQILNEAN